jgi:polysaccharide biosynthesis protein PslG
MRMYTSLLLGAIVFLPATGLGESPFQAGVGIHLGRPNDSVTAALAAIQSTELTFRGDAYWSTIETSKGVLSWPSALDDLDVLVDAMVAKKLRPILVLGYGNQFHDGGTQPFSNDGISAYVRYALYVVEHFRNRVNQFEVWNEWSFGAGARGAGNKGDAIQYRNLLRATYTAIKTVRSDVVVLGGGSGVGGKQSAWVTAFIAAGGLDTLDGFSVHPYVHCDGGVKGSLPLTGSPLFEPKRSSVPAVPSARAAVNEAIGGTPEEAISRLDTLHHQFDKSKPGKSVPIYITEMGWPTSSAQCGIPQFAAAAYLQRFFLQARARPWIAGVWWYDLFDDGNDDSNREHRFGLFSSAGRAKPAATGLQAILRFMNSSSVSINVGSKGEYVVDGRDSDGKKWYAAWIPTNDFDAEMEWPLGSQLLSTGYRDQSGSLTSSGVYLSAAPVILEHP